MSVRALVARWLRFEEAVGIDLGSRAIKVALVENVAGLLRLSHVASAPTPPGSIEGGLVKQPAEVAGVIRTLMASLGKAPTQAITAVSGHNLVVRVLRMPLMRDHQLEQAVQMQAEELVPFPLVDAIIEHTVLRREPNGDPPGMDVAVVVVPHSMTEGRVAALELAGLEPLAVDIEPFARMCSLLEVSTQTQLREEAVALIELGAQSSELTIVEHGRLALTRALTFGGDSLTKVVAAATKLNEVEAELVKQRDAIAIGLDQIEAPECASPAASLAMAPLVDSLVRQISHTVNSFRSQTPNAARSEAAPLDRMLLSGGTALLPGLAALLEERIGVPAEIANLFRDTAVDCPSQVGPALAASGALYSVALGLTLREHVRHGRHEWLVAA